MQKITPFLWFDTQAEEAMNFYMSIFRNSRTINVSRYGPDSPGPEGQVMVAHFELDGHEFMALNGGPEYKFNPAVSFMILCETQEEVDHYWDRLVEGGEAVQCGWLTDRYGVSWQITPRVLMEMIGDPDKEKAGRAMQAMLQMVKIDIPTLQRAFDGAN